MKRLFKGLAVLAAILVLAPIVTLAILQTKPGRDLLSSTVSSLASSPDMRVAVEGLAVGWALDASLDRVAVSDAKGIWLEGQNLTVDWAPASLLAGRLDIDNLEAGKLAVFRQPGFAAAGTDGEEPDETEKPSEDSLPLLPARVNSLVIDELVLGEQLIGETRMARVTGSGGISEGPLRIEADLDLQHLDEADGHIAASLLFAPDDEALSFDLTVKEPRGGLVARLLEVPNLPAIDLDLKGEGPLSDWAADLAISLDGRQTVTGSARLAEVPTGYRLDLDLDGALSPLMPATAAAFFLGTTDLTGHATFDPGFRPVSADLELTTRTLEAAARGRFDAVSRMIDGSASVMVSAGDDRLIALDLPDRRIAFGPSRFNASVKGPLNEAALDVSLVIDRLLTDEGKLGETRLEASSRKANLQPDALAARLAFSLTGDDLAPNDPKLASFAGGISLTGSASISRQEEAVTLSGLRLTTGALTAEIPEVLLTKDSFKANGKAGIANLDAFADLAGQPLKGSLAVTFQANGDIDDPTATLNISASGRNLAIGNDPVDKLLSGASSLTTVVELDAADDIEVKSLVLTTSALSLSSKGTWQDGRLSSQTSGTLPDITRLQPDVAGALAFSFVTDGPIAEPEVKAELTSEKLMLTGTPLEALRLTADIKASPEAPAGRIEGSGTLGGAPITLKADLSSEDRSALVEELMAEIGGNRVTGRFEIADLSKATETITGQLAVDAPDLETLSPLLLTEIAGSLTGDIVADTENGQRITLELKGQKLTAQDTLIDELAASADVISPFSAPKVSGNVLATRIVSGQTTIERFKLDADSEGQKTDFTGTVLLADGASPDGLTASGTLIQNETGLTLDLNRLDGSYQGLETGLRDTARLAYAGNVSRIEDLTLALGSGSLSLGGSIGEQLDLTARLDAVPLKLANAFAPGTGLGGTLSGTVKAAGAVADPTAEWSLNASGLTASILSSQGLPSLQVASSGNFAGGLVTHQTTASGADGMAFTASGKVGTQRPQSLNMSLEGSLPLSFLRRPLTEAGLRAKGSLSLSGKVSGTIADPQYQLRASPNGISITELTTALTLQDVTGSIEVNGETVTLSSLSAKLSSGGSVSASGTVGLGPDLAANIKATARDARYIDPGLVSAVVDADINVTGPLSGIGQAALIAGSITVQKADISIPETLPGAVSPVAVKHVNAPKAVKDQMAELGIGGPANKGQATPGLPPRLDIKVSAPGRIFVRGRGLDAELFGDLTIAGTTENPQAIGAFNLKRGQIDVLTRRLAFSKGTASFYGSLTPVIDFLATTSVNSTAINISVEGQANDPTIGFSSSPELPQDEAMALLLFGKDMGSLSPAQIAQLAAAVATLTGGSDNGPLAQIRKSLGLDNIDIDTSDEGGPTIGVGKYVNENIYLGVEQSTSDGGSRVKVDIDLDKGLKLRGEVGADGSSKAGIFFEKEY